MVMVSWWCLFLCATGCHGHVLRHGRSWNGYGFHTYPHPAKKAIVPRDIMVDVINNLGLKLLAIHNEYNENNIAISPYGTLSVLIALGEGLEGDAVHEIQKATHIPNDISVIRVGLRDIHRHLKDKSSKDLLFLQLKTDFSQTKWQHCRTESYFIPKEGFLAGLTLNHENVTLRPEYEDILRFYGYDTATFNNALYPPPSEATDSPETTYGETPTTDLQTTTQIGKTDAMDMTTEAITATTISEPVTSEVMPTETTTTLPETTTIVVTTKQTTLFQESTTVTLPQTTETKTTEEVTIKTTSELPSTTATTEEATTEASTTASTLLLSTSQEELVSTTKEISTTENTEVPIISVQPLEADTTIENIESTTNPPSTQVSTTSIPETTIGSTTLALDPTMISEITSTSTSIITDTTTTDTIPTTNNAEKDNEIDSTEGASGFGGVSKRKVRSGVVRSNRTNEIQLNMKSALSDFNEDVGFKRNSRSVIDYVIARYYDDQFNFDNNARPPYVPENQPSFLINGKYREYNVNFMKYNTVLPFHYEPHLDALALSFPLDSTKYYLLLLLPVDETGIDKLICDLRLNGSIKYIIENLQYRHVVATIPSFMLKGYVTLTPSFQKLGIRKVFEPRQADFAPMTSQTGIYVTNIEQAITVTIRNYVDPSIIQNQRNLHRYDPVHFNADHPFLYFVIDSDIHVTLMAGKIVNPLNSRIS